MDKIETLRNKTEMFLLPAIVNYDKKFIIDYLTLPRIKVGILDFSTSDKYSLEDELLFTQVCTKTSKNSQDYVSFVMKYRNKKDVFIDNYSLTKESAMLVFKFPETENNAFSKFLENKFSEMYTKDEIFKMFGDGNTGVEEVDIAKSILSQDENAEKYYVEEINKMYGTSLTVGEIENEIKEYTLGLVMAEETFNYDKSTTKRNIRDLAAN